MSAFRRLALIMLIVLSGMVAGLLASAIPRGFGRYGWPSTVVRRAEGIVRQYSEVSWSIDRDHDLVARNQFQEVALVVHLLGLTINALLGAALGVVAYGFLRPFVFRARPGRCRHCGYDLTGNVSGNCPECGTPIASKGNSP